MQPRSSNTRRPLSSTCVTRGSTGNSPRSLLQAIRTFLKSRSSGRVNRLPGSAIAMGLRGSGPAMALSIKATSCTVRAIGPATDMGNQATMSRPDGDPARRSPESDDIAEVARIAQGAAHITAVGQREHAAGQGHGRSTAAAAAGFGGVIGIQRFSEDRIESLGAGAEFRRVGLADGNGAGLFETLHDQAVMIRHKVFVYGRAPGGAHILGRNQILVGNGKTVQWSDFFTLRQGLIGGIGQAPAPARTDIRVTMALTIGFTRSI